MRHISFCGSRRDMATICDYAVRRMIANRCHTLCSANEATTVTHIKIA